MSFPHRPFSDSPTASLITSSRTYRTPSSSSSFLRDSWGDTPYASSASKSSSISAKFALSPDPKEWGSDLSPNLVEADDYIHNPDVRNGRLTDRDSLSFSRRGLANVGCLVMLISALLALFIGFPVATFVQKSTFSSSGFNLGGINASGQIPSMGNFGLIDLETPQDAYTRADWKDGNSWQLVFSDEFNTDGRSFYPGDDPYWEAVDLHYWATNNLEWYDPAAITTANGSLQITLSQKQTHNLNYQGGMVQTWNKFCFTGGIIEAAIRLPGINNVVGLWPAFWTMGNLGRAGYGASVDGMWPYTYDACDVGTAPNQTIDGQPIAAAEDGFASSNFALSYLPGQRLSRCTCDGESHPGPKHSDGTYVGRSAPEIDIFEAQVSNDIGQVSQSAQWAPFNDRYVWLNTSDNLIIPDPSISQLNTFIGNDEQEATSVVTNTNQQCYQLLDDCYSVYSFQYQPGFDDAYITWVTDNQVAWTLNVAGMGPDPVVNISARPVSQEPLYIILNLGMSFNFGNVDLDHLTFPATMYVDYIRVYQDPSSINIGCDPPDFPTAAYINTYSEAYSNPNLTTWVDDYGQTIPKNSLVDGCS